MRRALGSTTMAVLFLLLAGCGATREQIIQRTSVGLTAARAAYTAEDEREQMLIVAESKSREESEKRLKAHRDIRDAGTKAFQAAWAALAVASLQPSDENMGRLMELAGKAIDVVKGDAKQ